MQRRNFDVRWTVVVSAIALTAVVAILMGRNNGAAPPHTQAVARSARISETLGEREFRSPAAPTLAESLQAADLLVKAGKLAPPPTLIETLQAAVVLATAGVIVPPPPPLIDILRAAVILANAKAAPAAQDPPPPPLIDILRAAVILADAKAAPAAKDPPPPPLIDILRAGVLLADAKAALAVQDLPADGATGRVDDDFAAQMLSLVNQRRQAVGLQPLAAEPRLANSAATYAKVLADDNWFSHTGPDGSTLVTRDEAAGLPFTVQLGEVLAWGSDGWTAREIVQAWIDSPAHRDQILSPAYTRAGAGCYFTKTGRTMVRCALELAAG